MGRSDEKNNKINDVRNKVEVRVDLANIPFFRLGELTIHNIKCQDPLRAGQ